MPSPSAKKTRGDVIDFVWILTGLVLAAVGGSQFVEGAVGVARVHSLSVGVVGATLAAFATSSPELAVAIASAVEGRPEIALGDVAGSNVANLGLILGLAVLIRPLFVAKAELRRDLPWGVVSVVIVSVMILDGRLQRLEAVVLLLVFVAWLSRVLARPVSLSVDEVGESRRKVWIRVAIGLTALVVAGRAIVVGAEGIGERFGWSDFVVGALLVAVATSTPELVTVLVSISRGHADLGVGTLIGSNIFNTMFIVGVASAISEIDVDGSSVSATLMLGAVACVLMWPWRGSRLGRSQGLLLVAVFGAHLALTATLG